MPELSVGFLLIDRLAPGFATTRQEEVKQDGNHRTQGDAFQMANDHAADTEHQGHRNDYQVAGFRQVNLVADQGVQAHHRNGAEQQAENAAHYRHRNGLQGRAELAHERQDHRHNGGPPHDFRVEVAGQDYGAGDFRVGGVGRSAKGGGGTGGQAVAEQGAMQPRLVQVVLAGDAADGDDVANVLDG